MERRATMNFATPEGIIVFVIVLIVVVYVLKRLLP
jgi:hypothetical protein